MNEENLTKYYNKFNEDKRLTRRHGIVEFQTTIHYLEEVLSNYKNPTILDVGAGTGAYTSYLANIGYEVTPVELVKHNLSTIKKKCPTIKCYQGNALDLSFLKDKSYDIILLFGPLYHLVTEEDQIKALEESKKHLNPNGTILVVYIMNEYAILIHGFKEQALLKESNRISSDYKINPLPTDLYKYMRIQDINHLNEITHLKRIKLIAQDGPTDYMRSIINDLDDNLFQEYIKYHLSTCEDPSLLGASSHLLDIVKLDTQPTQKDNQ